VDKSSYYDFACGKPVENFQFSVDK